MSQVSDEKKTLSNPAPLLEKKHLSAAAALSLEQRATTILQAWRASWRPQEGGRRNQQAVTCIKLQRIINSRCYFVSSSVDGIYFMQADIDIHKESRAHTLLLLGSCETHTLRPQIRPYLVITVEETGANLPFHSSNHAEVGGEYIVWALFFEAPHAATAHRMQGAKKFGRSSETT